MRPSKPGDPSLQDRFFVQEGRSLAASQSQSICVGDDSHSLCSFVRPHDTAIWCKGDMERIEVVLGLSKSDHVLGLFRVVE